MPEWRAVPPPITSEDLYLFRWVDHVRLSPDGSRLAYSLSWADRDARERLSRVNVRPVGGGEIELTAEIYDEAARTARLEERDSLLSEPISADEILQVHELLSRWNSGLAQLLEPQPGIADRL